MISSWTGKCVAVTGATGQTGRSLLRELRRRGARVRSVYRAHVDKPILPDGVEWLEGDVRDVHLCERLLDQAEALFHLAAFRQNVAFHRQGSSEVVVQNTQMSLALVEALQGIGKSLPVVFFSSANVLPSLDILACAERGNADGYVLAKALCETIWLTAARQFGFPLLVLRPVGIYGPGDRFDGSGTVIPSLFFRAHTAKSELVVWGTGAQERAFVFVDDLVAATFVLLENHATGIQYVYPPEVVTIRHLAELIRDLVRPGLPLRFDPTQPEGERSLPLRPVAQALSAFAWRRLEDGLRLTLEAFMEKAPRRD